MPDSPFTPIFAPYGERVPAAFRDQFLLSPNDAHQVRLEGAMDVWHRPPWLAPLFRIMGAAGILVAQTGHDIPTTVLIRAGVDASGLPYHRFERMFHFRRIARFITMTVYDPRFQSIVDWAGPGGMIQVISPTRFEPPGTFTQGAGGIALGRGLRSMRVPRVLGRFLFGAARFTQRADDARSDTIHVDFTIAHPAFGDVFGYRGTFVVHQDPV